MGASRQRGREQRGRAELRLGGGRVVGPGGGDRLLQVGPRQRRGTPTLAASATRAAGFGPAAAHERGEQADGEVLARDRHGRGDGAGHPAAERRAGQQCESGRGQGEHDDLDLPALDAEHRWCRDGGDADEHLGAEERRRAGPPVALEQPAEPADGQDVDDREPAADPGGVVEVEPERGEHPGRGHDVRGEGPAVRVAHGVVGALLHAQGGGQHGLEIAEGRLLGVGGDHRRDAPPRPVAGRQRPGDHATADDDGDAGRREASGRGRGHEGEPTTAPPRSPPA